MNWDWDKLQEKRKRQSIKQPSRHETPEEYDNSPHNPDDLQPEERKERIRRENQFGRGARGGGGGGKGPDFGDFGGAFNRMRKSKFPVVKAAIAVIVFAWLLSGIFIVQPGEVGVVMRFGKHVRTVEPGPHYRLPYPVESVLKPNIHQVHRMEIGFRRGMGGDGRDMRRSIPDEAAMLTGDENIVYVHFIVQYQIRKAEDFLFNAEMQIRPASGDSLFSETVKNAAESAMREVIGRSEIDAAVYGNKDVIQEESRALLQDILNRYDTGVFIQNVQLLDVLPPPDVDKAFKDLINAREEKIRIINEAGAYRNKIIPEARGEAAKLMNEAEAYKETVEHKAKGEAARFLAVVKEYNKAKDITKKRLYLDTMEEVLSAPGMEKIIVAPGAAGNILPYLPLDRITTNKPGNTSAKGQN